MNLFSVSPWGMLAAVIVAIVIGFCWYSPMLFVNPWTRLHGLSEQDMKKGPHPITWIIMLVTHVGSAFVLSAARAMLGLASLWEMVILAVLLFLCVCGLNTLTNTLFLKKNIRIWLIEAGAVFATLMAQSIVISFF
jgi:hypothetical protein